MEFLGYTIDVAYLTESGLSILAKVVIALLIFFVGKWLAKKAVIVGKSIMARSKLDNTVASFLSNVLYGLLLVVVILAALNEVGVNTTSVVAILGGAAVAIGLSLKDQLANFAAGVMIILFRPFSKGDYVKINDLEGTVSDITLVNTRLLTLSNNEVIIPNSDITTNATVNYTSQQTHRTEIPIGIGYGADIKTAKDILLDLATNHPLTLKDPKPMVNVTSLGDNAVELTIFVWSKNADWRRVNWDLLEQAKYALDENDIEIPFPQRCVHVEGLDKLQKIMQKEK